DILSIIRSKKPFVIMFIGVNGTGKTTTIAKIGKYLMDNGLKVVFACSDTFRAGAEEQLEVHANRLGVKLIKHRYGADPAAVAYDAISYAKSNRIDVVLIDTAGRMQTDRGLMDEMQKIHRVAKPDLTVFVGDALTGNDALNQAQEFNNFVPIDAIVLTKIDADAKGGAAISISHVLRKPIIFLGVGQGYSDLIKFDPEWIIKNIFAMV
ncbi:MAG: signal recognition particle-docking protein FtsY, partial [Candidatus Methanomethyliaceae archaeon]|nr:signal recognition particle-docking protein FtsY [Candidatus Methanomethyliaceae archaeon]